MRHNCGGTLEPSDIRIEDNIGGFLVASSVPGLVCNACGEKLISPANFDRAQTPTAVMPPETSGLTRSIFDTRPGTSSVRLPVAA